MTDTGGTTYHALFGDDGVAMILVRLRRVDGSTVGESYRPGAGWVASSYAFDVMLNGQDYDLLDADEVDDVTAAMDRAEQAEGAADPDLDT